MIILRTKSFHTSKDLPVEKFKDAESERYSKTWREKHTGHPHIAGVLSAVGVGGASYGGYKLGAKLKEKKIGKDSLKEAKRERYNNNPKKVEIGYVKLKDKRPKKLAPKIAAELVSSTPVKGKTFSTITRLPVSKEDIEKAKTDGVVQMRPDGKWGIIAIKKGLWWSQTYSSRENAEKALRAYHAHNR
jgi:hypothetical protein